jgi:cysteine desulfurase family protein
MNAQTPESNRLYLDHAATSFPKPPAVHEAMRDHATRLGASAGRGAYREALETGDKLDECRKRLNRLFNGQNPNHFIFTLNCTDALNLAIRGLVDPRRRCHVICAQIDHNSILRPLISMRDRSWIDLTIVRIDPQTGNVDLDELRKSLRSDTRCITITHASNVSGTVQPIREIGRIAREHAVPLVVDAAQSAGHIDIDVQRDCIDLLCAPGHKGLLGPLGTGFLYIRPGVEKLLMNIREGGTGSLSEEPRQPDIMPDRFEAGSHNAIGIAGLSAALDWVLHQGIANLREHELGLMSEFLDGIQRIESLSLIGPNTVKDRVAVFSVRVDELAPAELSAILESSFGILSRSGLHCAPLAHEAFGTLATGGTTRLSLGPFVTVRDVKYAVDALSEIAGSVSVGRRGDSAGKQR